MGRACAARSLRTKNLNDVEFDETNGSQGENENLNDVRGAKLDEAMKYMVIGDVRLREV